MGDSPAAGASGISELGSNFGGRSVASYKVDKLLGGGVTPKTKFGTRDGAGGTVQDWAKGNSPQKMTQIEGQMLPKTEYRDFDYSDPEIMRQLATLQILDTITGQVDRHPGNYYIYQGPEGTRVIAIDNDLAFGKEKDIERVTDPIWKNRKLANDNSRGVPLFVDTLGLLLATVGRDIFTGESRFTFGSLELADGIDFSRPGAPVFVRKLEGLSVAEPHGRWSDATLAPTVKITLRDPLPKRFTLELTGRPFGPNLGKDITLRVGGRDYALPVNAGQVSLQQAVELGSDDVREIEIVLPQPASPHQLGMGEDRRKLGMLFERLRVLAR